MQAPPGGPPDFDPPLLLSTVPDSGAVVAEFDDPAEFRFDEVVSERSGGGLQNLIMISPRVAEQKVSWKRSRVTVEPKGGWQPNVVFHVTLLAGIQDLQNNRFDSTRTVVFSTGGAIPQTELSGTVIDWPAGRAAPRALVEAVLLPDSLVYVTATDSIGDFRLAAIPAGPYVVFATLDQNNNRLRESRELFDSVSVSLDTTFARVFWAFSHDTTGPRLREATVLDSLTIRLTFNQHLEPGYPPILAFLLPDTTAGAEVQDTVTVPIVSVLNRTEYDSLAAEERAAAQAAADSARAEADSLQAETDSLRADSVQADVAADSALAAPAAPPAVEERLTPVLPGLAGPGPGQDSVAVPSRIDSLLATRPTLTDVLFIRMIEPMRPGGRYLIRARVTNVAGALAESEQTAIAPMPPDST
jgi:hypothetical protein